jgi:hypothetical protein
MIVVDENLHSRSLLADIATWYQGQVISVTALRPGTIIKDDAIPGLLLTVNQPTFVTINSADFWPVVLPHSGYCIVAFAWPKERSAEISTWLRQLFRMPEFRSKAARMGKVVRVSEAQIAYYGADRRIHHMTWPEKRS